MLSFFPDLLAFGLIAPLILRLLVGILFLIYGYRLIKDRSVSVNRKWLSGGLMIVGGLLLTIGLFTQATTLILGILTLSTLKGAKVVFAKNETRLFRIVIVLILIALTFSGPGFFAFDLPL